MPLTNLVLVPPEESVLQERPDLCTRLPTTKIPLTALYEEPVSCLKVLTTATAPCEYPSRKKHMAGSVASPAWIILMVFKIV
jgi:hypothetical protein